MNKESVTNLIAHPPTSNANNCISFGMGNSLQDKFDQQMFGFCQLEGNCLHYSDTFQNH